MKNWQTGSRLAAFVLAALVGSTLVGAQRNDQADVLLQVAIHKEVVEGDLNTAIKQYEQILARPGVNRAVAATALLHIGQCYEKLGNAEARKAYDRLVREYVDQSTIVAEARTRLSAMDPGASTFNRTAMAVREIWAGPDVDIEGTPSPDGRFLTFIDWSTGDVAVRNLVTGEKRRLTNKGAWKDSWEYGEWPIVSPDGKQIAHAWLNKDAFYDLRIVSFPTAAESSPSRVAYRNEDVVYLQPFAWSPDGKQVLTVLTRKDRTNQMALISVADGSARILKSLEWRYPDKMSFSPDGRYIAYDVRVREDSPDRDIFVLTVDGRQEVLLVQHPAIDHAPVWTPDGRRVLFASDRRGSTGMWMIQVSEGRPQGAPELLKPDMGAMSPLGFLRDGSYYYGVRTGTEDVYTVELNPQTGDVSSAPTRLTERFTGSNLAGVWSPDGRRFAYFSRRGPLLRGPGSMAVIIRSLDTGEEREFFSNLEFNHRWPLARWFPDGRSLLLATRDNRGRWALQRMDAQTGAVTSIPGVLSEDLFPGLPACISPDGRKLYFRRGEEANPSKAGSIVAYELETGRQQELFRSTSKRILSLAISRDGQQLAFVVDTGVDDASSLQVLSVDGGPPRQIFAGGRTGDGLIGHFGIAWTHDDRFILFITYRSENQEQTEDLWRISPDGGTPQRILAMIPWLLLPNVHPDGRRLTFTAGQRERSEVWVMQNFLPPLKAAR